MSFVKVTNSATEFKIPPTSSQANLTVSTTAVTLAGLSFTIPAGVQYLMCQVQGNPLRMTYDGTTPSATVGQSIPAISNFTVNVALAPNLKFIREGAADAVLWVQPIGH